MKFAYIAITSILGAGTGSSRIVKAPAGDKK